MRSVYVALLRGINVGGKNMLPMKSLKDSFERLGFQDVRTYINSGNVLFRASESDARTLERKIDRMLQREYGLPVKSVVRSYSNTAQLVKTMSDTWKTDARWRYNVIFLRDSIDSARVLAGIHIKRDLERVVYCPGTLLWCARLNALTRTTMLKMASKPIYQDMTVRNVNTTNRIFGLMQQMMSGQGQAT